MTVIMVVQMAAQLLAQECVPDVKPLAMLLIAIPPAITRVRPLVKELVICHVLVAVTPAVDKNFILPSFVSIFNEGKRIYLNY